ncbi:MAG: hypothetical protein JSV04_05310, partial [Candidatus Heimdallarchaeota archaeon]
LGFSLIIFPIGAIFSIECVLAGSGQLIKYCDLLFLLAVSLLAFTLIPTCYYYNKIWREIPSDSPIKRASFLIIVGTVLIGLSYSLLITPQIFKSMFMINTVAIIVNIGSIGVLIASIFIFLGYRTKITDEGYLFFLRVLSLIYNFDKDTPS